MVTYSPQGAGEWPERLPAALDVYDDSTRQMLNVGMERFVTSGTILDCLEGQCALLSTTSWPIGRHDAQRWKAKFIAHSTGAVTQSQLAMLEKAADDTARVAYTSSSSWPVVTSKELSYELRDNAKLQDAQFEHLPALQAYNWAPMKILAFLMSNSKSGARVDLTRLVTATSTSL